MKLVNEQKEIQVQVLLEQLPKQRTHPYQSHPNCTPYQPRSRAHGLGGADGCQASHTTAQHEGL